VEGHVIGLLERLQPRAVAIFGFCFLTLAGMAGLVAWLDTVPPADQLLHMTGQLSNLTVRDAKTSAFTITLESGNAPSTFDLDNARALVAHPSGTVTLDGEGVFQGMPLAVDYYAFGRARKVVALTLGAKKVLSYADVASEAAEKVGRNQNSAIGFGIFGALLVLLGGLAQAARSRSRNAVTSDPDATIGPLIWLAFYGVLLVVMLTEPAILHRAFGTEAFHVPIEYVLAPTLALVLLPLWPGCAGLGSLMRYAMHDGSAQASSNPAERNMMLRTLWFFAYLGLLFAAWIFYAAELGI